MNERNSKGAESVRVEAAAVAVVTCGYSGCSVINARVEVGGRRLRYRSK